MTLHRLLHRFLGVDPGVRGGAGVVVIDEEGTVVSSTKVVRDPQRSIVQMMQDVWDVVKSTLSMCAPIAVAREDHNFLGAIERGSRNQLRRMNGALDMLFLQHGYVPGTTYMAFPVSSWKAVVGIPGDLGKEGKGTTAKFTKRKKITQKQYLSEVSGYLGHDHKNIDEADAHGIALALRRVFMVRNGTYPGGFVSLPENVQNALWDRQRAGATLYRVRKNHAPLLERIQDNPHFIRDFAP